MAAWCFPRVRQRTGNPGEDQQTDQQIDVDRMIPQRVSSALEDFKRIWGQLLLFAIATRLAVSLVLVPGLAFLLRLFISSRSGGALSDTEIASFLLSPIGLVTLVVLGGFAIGVAFVEQSGLMAIGRAASEHTRLGWSGALRFVFARLPRILPLGSHLLARALAVSSPLLALAGAVFWLFLTKHDINYYLNEKPPEFYWAGGIIGVLLAILAVLLIRLFASWMFALPALLFRDFSPREAIAHSVGETRGHRRKFVKWATIWLLVGTLSSVVGTWLTGLIGRLLIPVVQDSVELVALTIGGVGLVTLLTSFLVSLFTAAVFAFVLVRFYMEVCGEEAAFAVPEPATNERPRMRLEPRWILSACALGLLAAIFLANLILSRMGTEDPVLIIAHRGSAATAPENTMAAVRAALDAGTDFVEIDVQETADGEVVVFHDSDFMKTSRNPLKIWEAKRADLDRIDIGSWFDPQFAGERVPTLDQVLAECKGRATVTIELKYYGHDQQLEHRVVEAVERHDMSKEVAVMSLKPDKVAKIRKLRPDWTYGLLTSVQLGDIGSFEVDFLGVSASGASRGFVQRAQRKGFDVYVWTVNDPYQMSAMMSRGVDGIITDEPAVARRVREIRAGLSPVQRLLIGIGSEVGVFKVPAELPGDLDA